MNITIEEQARNIADGLGITVWITGDGRIVTRRPPEGIEVPPGPRARVTPHGAPVDVKPGEG